MFSENSHDPRIMRLLGIEPSKLQDENTAALTSPSQWLEEIRLPHLKAIVVDDTIPSLCELAASSSRAALLSYFKERGVDRLSERQTLANSLARAFRLGRLGLSAEAQAAKLVADAAAEAAAADAAAAKVAKEARPKPDPKREFDIDLDQRAAGRTDDEQIALLVDRFEERFVRGRQWPRLPAVHRVWAASDLHVEHAANVAFLEQLPPQRDAALIVAGDVGTDLALIESTLRMLAAKFQCVVYCVGNHELWQPLPGQTSFEKLMQILEIAEACGCHVTPVLLGGEGGGEGGDEGDGGGDGGGDGVGEGGEGLAIVPLQSWYRHGWLEPLADAQDSMSKNIQYMDVFCRWPRCLGATPDSPNYSDRLSAFMARLNQGILAECITAEGTVSAALRGRTLLTLSHFLPDRQLHMGFHWLGHIEGSDDLGQQVCRGRSRPSLPWLLTYSAAAALVASPSSDCPLRNRDATASTPPDLPPTHAPSARCPARLCSSLGRAISCHLRRDVVITPCRSRATSSRRATVA